MKILIATVLCAAAASLGACSHSDSGTAPLPRAYPRVALYDSVYSAPDSFPVYFEINSSVPSRIPRRGWLDVAYPRYGATLHLSAVDCAADRLAAEIERRRERMALNLYGMTAETRHMASDDGSFETVLLVSRDPVATPLQFLSVDTLGMIVSGSVYMPGVDAASPTDSVAPVVSAIERDLVRALKTMRRWN